MIYLVQDANKKVRLTYAIFSSKEDAKLFMQALWEKGHNVEVVERTLFFGQPLYKGYNR